MKIIVFVITITNNIHRIQFVHSFNFLFFYYIYTPVSFFPIYIVDRKQGEEVKDGDIKRK